MKCASLNHTYRLVWNDATQAYVAVAETTRARGKRASGAVLLAAALASGGALAQLPTGGQIVVGSGSITQSGTTLTVTQDSAKLAANWQSFSIGAGHTVNFVQPSASAVALNRVLGSDVSVIQGALNANGQVFLVNPKGVLFTPTAQVNVGGLVASTLNLSNEDFMAGNYTFAGASSNAIVNQGNLSAALGGTVALIAAKITNTGTIAAPQGNVLMGAGQAVTLDLGGPVKIQVSEGALQALIDQGGAIKADGGLVYLTAKAAGELASSVINHSGITEAQTLATGEKGEIWLMGDMERGAVNVGGTLNTSPLPAAEGTGVRGGFIETSAARVKVQEGAQVRAGHWLIDPYDFTIAASGGDITGTAVGNALASGNVTIATGASNITCTGVTGCGAGTSGNGDIFVNDGITWSSGNTLTLNAYRNIEINAPITSSHADGKLALEYGQGAAASGNTATYTINAPVSLQSGANFSTKLGSDGTVINYTVVNSQTDLQAMSLTGNYALGSSLTFTGTNNWTPIGTDSAKFTGRFDGLGQSISGLSISLANNDNVGLFGAIDSATIQNLTLSGGSITAANSNYVGALVGSVFNKSTITNVSSNLDVEGHSYVGGLIGAATGDSMTGDLVTISNSRSNGKVVASNAKAGGLVGEADRFSITNSSATGDVEAEYYIGGLVATASNGTITGSHATGQVTGGSYGDEIGGLVGRTENTTIDNSYATGNVSGGYSLGGLIGIASDGTTITNSRYTTGTVSGIADVGGLVGSLNDGSTISNSYATGAVAADDGAENIGGLVGYVGGGSTITRSYATSTVTVGDDASNIGGLVGYVDGGSVDQSYATGNVTAGDGASRVGGLIGQFYGNGDDDQATYQVTNSFATGNVTVGANSESVGGLIGSTEWSYVANTYAVGAVTAGADSNDVGGLFGANDGAVVSSYWNTETTGQSDSAGGEGKTTAQMQDIATFSDWDIDDDQTLTDLYPRLTMSDSGPVWKIKSVAASGGGGGGGGGGGTDGGTSPSTGESQQNSAIQNAQSQVTQGLLQSQLIQVSSTMTVLAFFSPSLPPSLVQNLVISNGVAFVDLPAGTEVTNLIGSNAGGADPSGFMRVFVVRGGIKYSAVDDTENRAQ